MSDFLTKLYQEEMEKVSQADLATFMDSLSMEELAAIAGVEKLAVGGPAEPEMPTGKGHETTDKSKEKGQRDPAADVKAEEEKKASVKLAMEPAKFEGRFMKGWSPEKKKAFKAKYMKKEGLAKCDAFTSPEARAKAKVMTKALRATKGAPPKIRKAAVKVTAREMKKAAEAPFG